MKRNRKFLLSVIVPVYNEVKRADNLSLICSHFSDKKIPFEVLVVNDGSTDGTLKYLKSLQRKSRFKVISYLTNKGKGFAIKTGFSKASGDFLLFMDVDLSTPLSEFDKFIPYLYDSDIVIGTRKTSQAKLIEHQPMLRENLGKAFTYLSQKILGVEVSDFTCGFKCFSKEAAKKISPKMKIDRWGFDSEILFLAKKYRLKVKEVPVAWKNDPQTKVKFPQDILRSLKELYQIRSNDFKGMYD